MLQFTQRISFIFFAISLAIALFVNFKVNPTWVESQLQYQTYKNEQDQLVYRNNDQEMLIGNLVAYAESPLRQSVLDNQVQKPAFTQQWVFKDSPDNVLLLKADFHFGFWSLLPALVAIVLCLLTREPLVALLGGIVAGAVMLGRFDITHEVFIPNLATSSAASILILYLWLLGGLMGMWAKTGAAQAFADHMSKHYVKGPRSAKLVTWFLGLIFFKKVMVLLILF